MGQVDDQQMPGQEQMPFAKLSRKEARERIDRYLSQRSIIVIEYDLTQPDSKSNAGDRLQKLLVDLGVVETPI